MSDPYYGVLGGTGLAGLGYAINIVNQLYVSAIVSFTQHAVAQWIWQGACKRKSHVPIFLVPFLAILLWVLLLLMDGKQAAQVPIEVAFYVGLAVCIVFGPCLHLLCAWVTAESAAVSSPDSTTELVGPGSNEGSRKEADCSDLMLENGVQVAQSQTEAPGPDPELAQAPAQKTKKRESIHYITNAKIFLTVLVIVHHAYNPFVGVPIFGEDGLYTSDILAFLQGDLDTASKLQYLIYGWCATNQSYFMALFFFYSGYFTPRSFDKKGRHAFLQDRLRRLGIPFVFCSFLWYPYVEFTVKQALFRPEEATVVAFYGTSVWWFLAALLSFSAIYAFLCGKDWNPQMQFPGMKLLFLSSFMLALWTTLVKFLIDPDAGLVPFLVPQGMLYIVLYAFAFFGGAIAQRNGWMTALRNISKDWNMVIGFGSLLWFVAIQLFFGLGSSNIKVWAGSDPARNFARLLLEAVLAQPGPSSLLFSLCVNGFFMHFCDTTYGYLTKFFSQSMYTAYIIQTLFIQIAFYLWCQIRKNDDDFTLVPPPRQGTLYFYSSSTYMVLFAGLFVSALSLITIFPIAWCIRSIPHFNKVL